MNFWIIYFYEESVVKIENHKIYFAWFINLDLFLKNLFRLKISCKKLILSQLINFLWICENFTMKIENWKIYIAWFINLDQFLKIDFDWKSVVKTRKSKHQFCSIVWFLINFRRIHFDWKLIMKNRFWKPILIENQLWKIKNQKINFAQFFDFWLI